MKVLVIVLAGILLFTYCDDESNLREFTFEPGEEFTLGFDELAVNEANQVSISLDAVLSDSRCPTNANCVWAGEATARFFFTVGENQHKIELSTLEERSYRRDTIVDEYHVEFIDLTPYPELNKESKRHNIHAQLVISQISDN